MIKDIQTASFFLKDGLNDNSSFRWCFCPGDEGGPGDAEAGSGGYGGIGDAGPAGPSVGGGRSAGPGGPMDAAGRQEASANVEDDPSLGLGDIADVAGLQGVNLGPMAGIEAYDEGYYDPVTGQTKTDKQYAMDILNELGRKGMTTTAQNMLDARAYTGLGIPEMNALERDYNLKTFGLGYRGPFEGRSVKGLDRASYNPNDLSGAGTDERAYNLAMFQSFAQANRGLTTVEAVAQHNAESPGLEVSISDVQSMGFDLNAPVGPQADFREAEAQRGLAMGIGLLAQGPISGLATIATDGKGMVGILSEVLGIEEEVEALGFGKVPSMQEVALDVFGPGPERDTMNPAGFNISYSPSTGLPAPTDADVGFTGFSSEGISLDGNEEAIPLSPQVEPIIKEEEEIIATPSPAFPTIDTVPKSRVDRIASIYNISKEAAERMLGVTA